MSPYPSNSNNTPGKVPATKKSEKLQAPKDIQKVTVGEAILKPKSIGDKAKALFVGSELKTAGVYILTDVLVPALRNLIVDTTTKGIERVIYGESTPPRRSQVGGNGSRYSYSTPVQRGYSRPTHDDRPPRGIDRYRSAKRQADDIILVNRAEAELVVERLTDIIDRYEHATLADLYDLVGFPSAYTDNNWGWSALGSVNIRQVREGYLIDLPPVEPIE